MVQIFLIGLSVLEGGLLAADAGDESGVDLVPRSHVLFHAGCDAGLIALGEGGAGLQDALFEAVCLDVLRCGQSSRIFMERVNWRRGIRHIPRSKYGH